MVTDTVGDKNPIQFGTMDVQLRIYVNELIDNGKSVF